MGYPVFNVGEVLTANDMNAVGLWRLNGGTITAGTTFTATGFSSSYRRYRMEIQLQRDAVGNTTISGRFANGATERTTGYHGAYNYGRFNSTTAVIGTNNGGTFNVSTANANGPSCISFDIFGVDGTTSTRPVVHGMSFNHVDLEYWSFGYTRTTTEVNDRIRIFSDNGNVSGSWALYGYRD